MSGSFLALVLFVLLLLAFWRAVLLIGLACLIAFVLVTLGIVPTEPSIASSTSGSDASGQTTPLQ